MCEALRKLTYIYLCTVVIVFSFAAYAKLTSDFTISNGIAKDPVIFFLTISQTRLMAAIGEMLVAILVAWSLRGSPSFGVKLAVWFSALFLVYRVGLFLAPVNSSCGCLGRPGGILFGDQADNVALALLFYLIISGVLVLLCSRRMTIARACAQTYRNAAGTQL